MKLRKVFVMLLILICLLGNTIMASADYIPAYADSVYIGGKNVSSSYTFIGSYTVPANARVVALKGTMSGGYYFYDYLYYYLNGSMQACVATKYYEQSNTSFYYIVNVSAGNTISFYASSSASADTLSLDAAVVLAYDFPSQTLVNQTKTSADNAKTAADNAKASADTAAANASNSFNAVNNANGNTITAVRDATGTALAEARQSKANALNAYNEAHTANTKIDSLQAAVTNIQNNLGGDTSPPAPRLRTVSGAAATSGSSILAVLDISDNVSSTFTYSLDGSAYIAVPANKVISLPVNNAGANVISVWVKDQAGNIATTSITIRKL